MAATVNDNGVVQFENGKLGTAVLPLDEDGVTPASGGGASGGILEVGAVTTGDATEVGLGPAQVPVPSVINVLSRYQDALEAYQTPVTPGTATKSAATETELIAAPGSGLQLEIDYLSTKQLGAASNDVSYLEDGGAAVIVHEMITQGSTDKETFSTGPWRLTANTALNVSCSSTSETRIHYRYRIYDPTP